MTVFSACSPIPQRLSNVNKRQFSANNFNCHACSRTMHTGTFVSIRNIRPARTAAFSTRREWSPKPQQFHPLTPPVLPPRQNRPFPLRPHQTLLRPPVAVEASWAVWVACLGGRPHLQQRPPRPLREPRHHHQWLKQPRKHLEPKKEEGASWAAWVVCLAGKRPRPLHRCRQQRKERQQRQHQPLLVFNRSKYPRHLPVLCRPPLQRPRPRLPRRASRRRLRRASAAVPPPPSVAWSETSHAVPPASSRYCRDANAAAPPTLALLPALGTRCTPSRHRRALEPWRPLPFNQAYPRGAALPLQASLVS